MHIERKDAIVGLKYRVVGKDCCLQIYFDAVLVEKIADDPGDDMPELRFDNGVKVSGLNIQLELLV